MPTIDFHGQRLVIGSAYSYDRVSSPRQTPEQGGEGIDRQAALRAAFVAQYGIAMDEELVDLGKSGSKGSNLEDGAALAAFRKLAVRKKLKPNPALIIESFSRLGRLPIDRAMPLFFDIIGKGGVTLITLVNNRAYTRSSIRRNPGEIHEVSAQMQAARAEAEARAYYSKMNWVMRRGKITVMCPGWLTPNAEWTGYDIVEVEYVTPDGKRIRVSAKEIVERIYREGEYLGLSRIAAQFNQEGIPKFPIWNHQKTPNIWRNTHIRRIIKSRNTRGEREIAEYGLKTRTKLIDGEEVEYELPHRTPTGERQQQVYPPVVSEEQWQRTNVALEARTTARGRKGAVFTNLLQGLLKCAHCGATMVIMSKKKPSGREYQYLRCVNLRWAACHNRFSYRYPQVESEFVEVFRGVLMAFMEQSRPSQHDPTAALHREIAEVQADISGLQSHSDHLRKEVLKKRGTVDADKLMRLLDVSGEREAKLAQLAKLEKKIAQTMALPMPEEQVATLRRLIDRMGELQGTDRYAVRARLNAGIKAFVGSIEFDEAGAMTVRFGANGKPYPPDPRGLFERHYTIRFTPNGVEREHPYLAWMRLLNARAQNVPKGSPADGRGRGTLKLRPDDPAALRRLKEDSDRRRARRKTEANQPTRKRKLPKR